jgi:hypothetical protein
MDPLELGSQLARESFPELGGVLSDNPVYIRGFAAHCRLDSIGGTLAI